MEISFRRSHENVMQIWKSIEPIPIPIPLNHCLGTMPLSCGQIKPELDSRQSLLFSCYERALEKVDFLLKIPYLTQRMLQGDTQVQLEVGSDVADILYNLHKIKSVWTESDLYMQVTTFSEAEWKPLENENEVGGSTEVVYQHGSIATIDSSVTPSSADSITGNCNEAKMETAGETTKKCDIDTPVTNKFKSQIQNLYRELFRQLMVRRQRKNSGTDRYPVLNNLNFPPSALTFTEVSNELLLFQTYFSHLKELFQSRLLSIPPDLSKLQKYRSCWKRLKCAENVMKKLEKNMQDSSKKWISKIETHEKEILKYEKKIGECRGSSHAAIKNIVRNEFLEGLEHQKTCEQKTKYISMKNDEKKGDAEEIRLSFLGNEEASLQLIRNLEQSLHNLLASYDSRMMKKQEELDNLETTLKSNEVKIEILEKCFADTEERFEEMKITKRLKELLRKMEMADNFKRNRAARIIQSAWRRYYQRKLRRMKRRAKMKRKPRIPGQSSSKK